MLYKKEVDIKSLKNNDKTVLAKLNSIDEVPLISQNKIRKISIDLKILKNSYEHIKKNNIKYIRLLINNKEYDLELIKNIKSKNNFIEIILPMKYYYESLIYELKFVDRIIFEIDTEKELNLFKNIEKDIILNEIFPYTKNIPMCIIKPEQCFELFCNNSNKKPKSCEKCIYYQRCHYNKNFEIQPIKKDKDYERFINKDEDIIHRI